MNAERASPKPVEARAKILVASDNLSDAVLVRKLLMQEFELVFVSTNQVLAVKDFESHVPDVLVLAFNTLAKAERYYLGLYRLSGKIHLHPHRTVVLCNMDEVSQAYQACRKQYFDDYVQFWPMTNDAPRLLMSVHHSLRGLMAISEGGPSAAEFAAQARRLAELGSMLDQHVAQGSQKIDMANRAMAQAEQDIGAALDGFSSKLAQGSLPGVSRINDVTGLEQEIKRLKQEEIGQRFRKVAESVQPIKQWTDDFRKEFEPHVASARTLNAMADAIRPMILIVDDDDFQSKLVSKLLAAENYRLVFASGGVEALNVLRKMQPDLILMDIMMPDLDGIETTRRLKTMPQYALVPVIMLTGKSEGAAVRDSIKAGAADFIVKPFDRDTLLAKVTHALHP
ncbi:MAG: response regulator [Sulfuriferula multivorans]|uniref:Response regulator n=1 Tax=Sulfuriferula multivorans TaxID=1559896 RepID=A0A7C9K8T5_9PROT|nr:response regulator [Sulfuriferula multivorans]